MKIDKNYFVEKLNEHADKCEQCRTAAKFNDTRFACEKGQEILNLMRQAPD